MTIKKFMEELPCEVKEVRKPGIAWRNLAQEPSPFQEFNHKDREPVTKTQNKRLRRVAWRCTEEGTGRRQER